jgi:hypothetical protein
MKIEINGEEHWVAKTITRREVFVSLALYIDECKLPYELAINDISDELCELYAADVCTGFINYRRLLETMGLSVPSSRSTGS